MVWWRKGEGGMGGGTRKVSEKKEKVEEREEE